MCKTAKYDEPAGDMVPAASWAGREAVLTDRLQLARELHDVVASGLATITLQASLAERVRVAVKEMHSYTTPAILVMPVESVDKGYLDWIMAESEAP